MGKWSNAVFAKNLRKYMERSGKTQRDMAEIVGVSSATMSDWLNEKKYPRIDKIEILANYFQILKSDLIEEKLTPEKEADADFLADVVVRMRMDAEYGDLVKFLYKFDAAKCAGIHQMLRAFDEQPSDKFK